MADQTSVEAKINTNLSDSALITPAKHREVELEFTAWVASIAASGGGGGGGGTGGSGKVSMATGISGSGAVLTNSAFNGKTITMVSNKTNGNLYAGEDFTQAGNVLTFTNGTMYAADNLYYFF